MSGRVGRALVVLCSSLALVVGLHAAPAHAGYVQCKSEPTARGYWKVSSWNNTNYTKTWHWYLPYTSVDLFIDAKLYPMRAFIGSTQVWGDGGQYYRYSREGFYTRKLNSNGINNYTTRGEWKKTWAPPGYLTARCTTGSL
jgi:hypothetical protein